MFQPLKEGLADILFPRNCLLCRQYIVDFPLNNQDGKSERFAIRPGKVNNTTFLQLCFRCYDTIEFNTPPFCLRCSRHLDVFTPEGLCATCLKYPIAFDSAWGAVSYTETVQKLLHLFKYQQKTAIRQVFNRLMQTFLTAYSIPLQAFDALVPVPLHPVRLRERGFNQSQLLADYAHTQTGLPVWNALTRVRPTHPQAFLGQKERWTNLEGAFRMNPAFNINSKSILLIDDLLTTGATASAAAQTLKKAGATKVGLLVVALAP